MLGDPEYNPSARGFRRVFGTELGTTLADQVVIAIENVRLFEAEQHRTRQLTESHEQQTATSEVLAAWGMTMELVSFLRNGSLEA